MYRMMAAIVVACMAARFASAQEGPSISVKGTPPVVVKTVPEAGNTEVDPTITEIRVTFSKRMAAGHGLGLSSPTTPFHRQPASRSTSRTARRACCRSSWNRGRPTHSG